MAEIAVEDYSWVEPEYLAHKSNPVQGGEKSFDPLEIGVSSI